MDNSEKLSEQSATGHQANQLATANRIAMPVSKVKNRALSATQNTNRSSYRRRSCSWASRQR